MVQMSSRGIVLLGDTKQRHTHGKGAPRGGTVQGDGREDTSLKRESDRKKKGPASTLRSGSGLGPFLGEGGSIANSSRANDLQPLSPPLSPAFFFFSPAVEGRGGRRKKKKCDGIDKLTLLLCLAGRLSLSSFLNILPLSRPFRFEPHLRLPNDSKLAANSSTLFIHLHIF